MRRDTEKKREERDITNNKKETRRKKKETDKSKSIKLYYQFKEHTTLYIVNRFCAQHEMWQTGDSLYIYTQLVFHLQERKCHTTNKYLQSHFLEARYDMEVHCPILWKWKSKIIIKKEGKCGLGEDGQSARVLQPIYCASSQTNTESGFYHLSRYSSCPPPHILQQQAL